MTDYVRVEVFEDDNPVLLGERVQMFLLGLPAGHSKDWEVHFTSIPGGLTNNTTHFAWMVRK